MLACLPFHNKIWAGEVLITSPDCSPRTAQYPEYIQLYRKKCFYYFHTRLQMIAEQGTQQLGDINDFWRESSQWHRSLFSLSTKVGSRQIHPQPFTPLCTYFVLFHPLIPLHICRSLTLPPVPFRPCIHPPLCNTGPESRHHFALMPLSSSLLTPLFFETNKISVTFSGLFYI